MTYKEYPGRINEVNSSKAREQKSDLRDDKRAMNALIERQGGRQSSDVKKFMEGRLQAYLKREST